MTSIKYTVFFKKYETERGLLKRSKHYTKGSKEFVFHNNPNTTSAMARRKFFSSLSKKDKSLYVITSIK